jgi:glycosyltransferase involved in cell wall biosynthesis
MDPYKKKPIKVLFITPYYFPVVGGAEIALHNLCEALSKRGVEPFLLTSLGPKGKSHEQIGSVNVFRYETRSVLRRINNYLARLSNNVIPIQHFEGFYCAYKLIKKYDIDLIHLNYFRDTSIIGYLCKKTLGKPLITHLVGNDIFDPVIPVPDNNWHYYSLILNNSTAVVAASAFVKKIIHLHTGVKDCKIIPYGLDTQVMKPLKQLDQKQLREHLGIGDDDKIVISVQRLDPRKKVEVLLRAARIVVDTLPNTKYIIVGDGPERTKLERIKKQLGVDENVIFTREISYEDLIKYLSMADVFSMHTMHEGFGIVFIEAMSMGLPIVTTYANGNEGIIENGKNGFMVEPNDPFELADKTIFLLKDDEIRKNMSQYNRDKAKKEYDLTVIADQWTQLYEESLSVGT